jgi:hypothetical protein
MTGTPYIALSVQIDRSTVRYELRVSRRSLKAYFSSEKMFVTYDVDLTGVPEAFLVIPGLSTLAPIAWILGAELHTPIADTIFLESLQRVRQSLQRLYPSIHWGGDVRTAAVVNGGDTCLRGNEALLFSGGVDSLACFVSHRHARPRLLAVWGADVGLGQPREWEEVIAATREFARSRSLAVSLVKSNFRTFFNHYKLRTRFFSAFPNWYSAAQHGLGLVGLCAPLSYVHGLTRIRIASTHTAEWAEPWGSHPTIDGEVQWASTEVLHDGYQLSRQMKLGLLAEYIRHEAPRLPVRVCWGRGGNCSRCTKCCLTMIGLALEGLDPNHHGFRFDTAALSFIRTQLEEGFMALRNSGVWRWMEIQKRAATQTRLELDGLDEFFAWLQGVSIPHCQAKFKANLRRPSARVAHYLATRPEPVGRWIRKWRGHSFP